ncbi:hypothetical protein [Streptomyces sp. NBC_01276]|uniref:hypothetical protein n=1 Tax=Streptomyces sp. NBC_01276 TaxID=2903808 RepID=UPI00352E1D71
MDYTQDAEKYRIGLPDDPRSTVPRGPHIAYFDSNRGWIRFTFLPRVAEPQIVVEEIFWQ